MLATYTLNSKVFNKTSNPSPTAVVLTTRSRGDQLPDNLTVSHKETANPIEKGITDRRSLLRVDRTYLSASGVYKENSVLVQFVTPSDCPAADVAACLLDVTDFLTSAITLDTTNVGVLTNGEVA